MALGRVYPSQAEIYKIQAVIPNVRFWSKLLI